MDAWCKSLDGSKYTQVFAAEDFFTAMYPHGIQIYGWTSLKEFISDFGIPDKVICNGAHEHTGKMTEFMQQIGRHHIDLQLVEPGRHNISKVECVIRELWKRCFCVMAQNDVPK